MICFRRLIDVFFISLLSAIFILSFLYKFPNTPRAQDVPPNKEFLQRASIVEPEPMPTFGCGQIESLVGETGLEVKQLPQDGWMRVGRKESTKSLIVLSYDENPEGCLLTLFSVVRNVDYIIGVVTANFWNKDMAGSTAFFDDEQNTLVLYDRNQTKSPKMFVGTLGTFRDDVLRLREDLEYYTERAISKNPA